MANNSEQVTTTEEMRPEIICPLCFAIAAESVRQGDGSLGAVQSYRCMPKPTRGGWETRPQKDKWSSDFFKVLHGDADEKVTLSDGVTEMTGLGKPDELRFMFPHEQGVQAKKAAMEMIKAGKLRAPRNWDKVFAGEADMTLQELKNTYPELYQTRTRAASETEEDADQRIEAVSLPFLQDQTNMSDEEEDAEEVAVAPEALDEEDDAMIAAEEHAYSITAEEIEDVIIEKPSSSSLSTLHGGVKMIKCDMGEGVYITFYKVEDPETGKMCWLHSGQNEDLSHINLIVKEATRK